MYVVIRLNVSEDKAEIIEREAHKLMQELLESHGLRIPQFQTEYERSTELAQHIKTYTTDAESAYQEVVLDILESSDGQDDLIRMATDELFNDISSRA